MSLMVNNTGLTHCSNSAGDNTEPRKEDVASPKSHNSSIVKYETRKWKHTNTEACSRMGIKYEKNEQTFLFLKQKGHLLWLKKKI